MEAEDATASISKEITAISKAINHLGFHLYRQLAKNEGNVFFSPLSLSTAMAMAFCGAQKETAEEMKTVLGYEVADIQDEEVSRCFQSLLLSMDKSAESYTLNNANVAFSQCDFSVKEEFKKVLEESFKAMIFEMDFNNEPEKALEQANEWVKDNTNGMIPLLLESLDPATVMIILNAVYFKGFWMNKFQEKETFLQYFYNNGIEDDAKRVEMMHLKESFLFVEKESYKALELPYKGEELAMLILLPKDRHGLEDLKELESQLSSDFLQSLKTDMHKTKVEVALPKFRLAYSEFMKDSFQSLGVNRAFCSGAQFGGISESEGICISEIVHKAVLEVNEEGSEAAAATAVLMVRYCISFCPEFVVDHPFLFLIYNSKNDVILFLGKVDEL